MIAAGRAAPLGPSGYVAAVSEKTPRMRPVDSGAIAAVGYDPERRELLVTWRGSGDTYAYADVAEFTYRRLLRAESPGAFVNKEIKPTHAFREL